MSFVTAELNNGDTSNLITGFHYIFIMQKRQVMPCMEEIPSHSGALPPSTSFDLTIAKSSVMSCQVWKKSLDIQQHYHLVGYSALP